MTILITGAAGYIGSHTALALRASGYDVVLLDDLSTGSRRLLPDGLPFCQGHVADTALLLGLLREHRVTAVMHFAGSIVVPDSVADPLGYYRNNSFASAALIEACVEAGVGRFIFSSTAAVYGLPDRLPVDEDAPTRPINPYGTSKLMTEWMLRDTAAAHGLRYLALRYFNVAGADPDGRSGQVGQRATHLIKVACEAAVGRRDRIQVFGTDYDTPDGTCVRDYIHVSDLAEAHVAALRRLEAGGPSEALNCGYGRGYSVRQVLDTVQRIAGRPLEIVAAARRPGDPPSLVCTSDRLRDRLAWQPRYDDLEQIVGTALAWERKLSETTTEA